MESRTPLNRDVPIEADMEEINLENVDIVQKHKWYHINLYSLPAKLSYICEASRRLSYTPHLVLFLTGIGLSEAESGYIMGFRLLGMLVGGPFWGMIADKWKCHRIVITIMCVMSILLMCSQPFVTYGYSDLNINRCPYNKAAIMKAVSNCSTLQNCTETKMLYSNSTTQSLQQSKHRNSTLFFIMLFMYIAAAFFEGSAIAFVDTGTIRRIQLSKHRKIDYGRQKMWAAVGAAFGNVSTNIIIEYFPSASVTCYSGIFVTYAVYTVLLTVSLLYLYRGLSFEDKPGKSHGVPLEDRLAKGEENNDDTAVKESLYKTLKATLSQFDIIFLYMTTFVCGILYSPYSSFFFLYLKDLKGSPTLFSLTIPIAAVGVFLGFFISVKIIKIIGCTWKAMALSFLAIVVRYLGFGLVRNPWLVLIFQPLHAITYSLFLTAGLTHLKETSPVSVITTMVSTLMSLHFGVGPIVGTSISGIVYEKYGGSTLFCGSAVLAFFWCILVIVYAMLKKQSKERKVEEI